MDDISQQPKCGPYALFVGCGVVAEADLSLDDRLFPLWRGEYVFGLDPSRGPLAYGGFQGNYLERAPAGYLDVSVGGGVILDFVVGMYPVIRCLELEWEYYR